LSFFLAGMLLKLTFLANLHSSFVGPRTNTSRASAAAYRPYNPLASGQSSVNGHPLELIARNISTDAVSGADTTEPTLVRAE
jgi:hypothetical protein